MGRILVIDDDPDVVESTQIVLESRGHEVAGAGSREEGMRAVEEFAPDLIILDVMMEQADDGIAMAQELRKKGFAAPIMMLSGIGRLSGMDYGKDGSLVPVDDFQEKPIDPIVLIEKVDALLSRKED